MENLGLLYSLGAAIVWGLVYTLDQKILHNLSPVVLLFYTSVITAIILLPVVIFKTDMIKSILSLNKYNILLILFSIFLGIGANLLIFSGIKTLGASTSSFLEISYPFFVVLFSSILFRIYPNIYFILGGIIIFIGSLIIVKLG